MITTNSSSKSPILITTVLALAFMLSACEKVIDIDLKNATPKFVIEATLTDQVGGARVLISKTKQFSEDNSFVGIPGAMVSITEEGGPPVLLTEIATGVYQHTSLTASAGKKYTLFVSVEGESFTALSAMPVRVNLDTLYIVDEFLFSESRKLVNVEYIDPIGKGNSYRFIQYVNGRKEKQIMLHDDDYSDGRPISSRLYYFSDEEEDDNIGTIKSGDTIIVDMLCINQPIYKYWFSLANSATGSSQTTPANPVTNITGGALGYFSTHTLQTKSFIVP